MGPGERASALNPRLLGLACGRYEERTPRKLTALFSSLGPITLELPMRRSVANAAWCVLRRFKADDEFVELVLQVNPSLSAVKPPAQRLRFETGGGYRATRCGPQWANGDRLVFDLGDFPVGRPVVGQELVVEATAPGTKARKNLDDPQAGVVV